MSTASARLASSLPPDIHRQLEHSLQWYQEARERWPLWTGAPDAWARCGEAWADQIQWSAVARLYDLSIEFRSVIHEEFKLLRYLPDEEHYYWASLATGSRFAPFGKTAVPGVYRLRALAIAASMARRIPTDVMGIEIPDLARAGLEASEIDALADRFSHALTELRLNAGERRRPMALAGQFLKYHIVGAAGESRGDDWIPLAKQLLVETGLLVDRSHGRRNTLDGRTLGTLRTEARNMVESIQSWSPVAADVMKLAEWVVSEPEFKPPTKFDLDNLRRMLEAKRDSTRERGYTQLMSSWAAREIWRLRYPFLTESEYNFLRDKERTVVQLADELILRRLPAELSPSRLRAIISSDIRKTQ